MSAQIQVGKMMSFEVYPSQVLGSFRNVVIDSILSPAAARSFGVDINAMHAAVYRTLPNTVPDNPNGYQYVRVRFTSGEYSVIGLPYIKTQTIEEVSQGVVRLTLNNVNNTDYERLLTALSANGFTPTEITYTQENTQP